MACLEGCTGQRLMVCGSGRPLRGQDGSSTTITNTTTLRSEGSACEGGEAGKVKLNPAAAVSASA